MTMTGAAQRAAADAHPEQVLLERLEDPRTAEQLVRLLDKLDNVVFLLEMVEGFLRRGPEIADSINDMVIQLRQALSASGQRAPLGNVFHTVGRLQEFLDSPQVQSLFRSDVLDVRFAQVVGKLARAMIQASEDVSRTEPKRIGLIGLMRALGDPDVQLALQFVLSFAKRLSRELHHA